MTSKNPILRMYYRLRTAWYLHVTARVRWKWVGCVSHDVPNCCNSGCGGFDDCEFLGCQADAHNDWIAARFYRRLVANARAAIAKARGRA